MEWRTIKGFPNYSVSDHGDIRNNTTSKILKGGSAGRGYRKVVLCQNGIHTTRYIHRIVADAFLPVSLDKPEINHIDGNKRNNSVENLERVTRKENMIHLYNCLDSTEIRRKMGVSRKGTKNGASRKIIRIEDGKIYPCISEAAKDIGVHRMCISDVCRGIQKTSKGYHYRYIGEGMVDKEHKDE